MYIYIYVFIIIYIYISNISHDCYLDNLSALNPKPKPRKRCLRLDVD